MTLAAESSVTSHFKIKPSKTFLKIEIALHLLVLVCIVQLIDWPDLILFLLLYFLLTLRYFSQQSIIKQFSNHSMIRLNGQPITLCWKQAGDEFEFTEQQIKILMTRWFILLQLGKGRSQLNRLLMADSFERPDLYACFRRTIIENNLC